MKLVQFSNPDRIVTYPAEGASAFKKTVRVGDMIVGEYVGDADLTPYTGEWPYISPEQKATEARQWRDEQLVESDWIVPITDHPQRAAYLTYRQALRDWPGTADFPDTKPVLGS